MTLRAAGRPAGGAPAGALLALSIAALFAAASCDGGNAPPAPPSPPPPAASPPPPPPGTGGPPALQEVADGLASPVYLTAPPGDDRLFVVEQGGTIRVLKDGQVLEEPFLDLRGRITSGGERGLLSMAFHPRYASNGRFFVYFTDLEGDIRIEEHRVSSDPDRADAAPGRTLLTVDHPRGNHNGGLVLFGPDGRLYAGLGDGGGGGDPDENGQDLGTLLGKILRLDVDGSQPYSVPPDNPFVGQAGARGEIWAYGLRNPWRFSFDRQTGDLYIADVGQNAFEEVNAVAAGVAPGLNYGWNIMEGTHCFEPEQGCDQNGLTLPVIEYGRSDGCSVTGGYVYRGSALPDLGGTYFYSDFCEGFIRSFELSGGAATEARSWPELEPGGNVTSFGEDAAGELYLTTHGGGVYKIVPS